MIKKISLRQSIYISKRIAFLLGAGIALPQAFTLVAKQMKKRGDVLNQVAIKISEGQQITKVISETNIFGSSAVPMITIGEESGTLAESFSAISDELEKRALLQQKIVGAMLYPACITFGMFILIIVLMVFVFPKMLGVFESLHVTLPLSTRILIWTSDIMRRFGLYFGFFIAALIIYACVLYKRSEKFHLKVDQILLEIPFISLFVRTYMLVSISNIIGLLLTNHSTLLNALQVAGQTCKNYAYREVINAVADNVSSGASLGDTMNNYLKYFPKEYCDLVSIGEQTGKLSETFVYSHDLYSRDLDMLTKSLSSSIEPILMVVIGVAIGIVAFSIVTPMYSITSHLHST